MSFTFFPYTTIHKAQLCLLINKSVDFLVHRPSTNIYGDWVKSTQKPICPISKYLKVTNQMTKIFKYSLFSNLDKYTSITENLKAWESLKFSTGMWPGEEPVPVYRPWPTFLLFPFPGSSCTLRGLSHMHVDTPAYMFKA